MSNFPKASEKVFYFAYGQNRDSEMIEAITGRKPGVSYEAVLKDYELCVQNLGQIPEIPRGIVARYWEGELNFKARILRPKKGSQVKGTVHLLSPDEWEMKKNYELVEVGWSEERPITIPGVSEGSQINAVTEVLGPDQEVERVEDGMDPNLSLFLNDREKTIQIASQVRREFLQRVKGEGQSTTGELKQ